VQDVFCELWIRRKSIHLHDTEAVRSYLFKAVCNRSLNALAQKKLPGSQLPPGHVQNPEQSLLTKELDAEITLFVGTLPPQCRKVFTLSRSAGLKNAEIAGQLEISIKAVEKHTAKALRALKDHLEKKGFFG
jgi:RNA polymerase sigma-70 factor (ECF subfamily)